MIDFSNCVVVPDQVLAQKLDDEMVLLQLESETYFGLDDVGSTMWEHLTTADSIDSAYQALLDVYEVEPDQLRADLQE
jgi:hypothetical protein